MTRGLKRTTGSQLSAPPSSDLPSCAAAGHISVHTLAEPAAPDVAGPKVTLQCDFSTLALSNIAGSPRW